MTFAYNCDLYYREYFPDYDLGWWLFAVTIVVGSIGVVVGGVVSDKFVAKMGVRSRVAVLAISQVSSRAEDGGRRAQGGITAGDGWPGAALNSCPLVLPLQLISTPFAFGSVYLNPVGAMITLGVSYFFGGLFSPCSVCLRLRCTTARKCEINFGMSRFSGETGFPV